MQGLHALPRRLVRLGGVLTDEGHDVRRVRSGDLHRRARPDDLRSMRRRHVRVSGGRDEVRDVWQLRRRRRLHDRHVRGDRLRARADRVMRSRERIVVG